ncbi:hypothetical protein H2198_008582 [Neophaeococcomyces mojaviensis]|uniref:Uncharacterized protein n=1 Tax=Neophaeococcomyces mojaviensis TaxID=3383035 RepID=A0ACC2ZX20_9EURO|nr:hypothetical protein H2198_008582 [Knufia sp. JES_112]
MSRSSRLIPSKRQCRVVNTHDNTTLDDFFRQPSAHELSVADHLSTTSESRIFEIISDLQRLTTEELENWSTTAHQVRDRLSSYPLSPAATPVAEVPPSNKLLTVLVRPCKTTFIPEAELVSSPFSLSHPPFLAKSSNPVAVFESNFSARHLCSPPRTVYLALPSKLVSIQFQQRSPSNAPSTSQPQTGEKEGSERDSSEGDVSPVKPSFQSFLNRVPLPADAYAQSRGATAVLPASTSVVRDFAIEATPSGRNRFSFEPDEVQEIPNPSSLKGLKRKPLPPNSPLLVSLDVHPAFAASSEHLDANIELQMSRRNALEPRVTTLSASTRQNLVG